MTEDARWSYRVTIRYKNSTVATTPPNPKDEAEIEKKLWPDQSEALLQDCPLCVRNLPATSLKPSRSCYCLHGRSIL
jgi:hypothetical protein